MGKRVNDSADRPHEGDAAVSEARPGLRVGPGVVLLLAGVHFTAFVDRAVPSVVAVNLKSSFGLLDAQIGALQGPAFATTYAVLMLITGHWVARAHPFRLAALCVAVWTAGGVVFALAQSHDMLMFGRMLLGAGQAAFAPAALLILASDRVSMGRARAVSMFTSGSAIGRSGALFLGGGLLMLFSAGPLAGLEPWRLVSLLLVAPNLILIVALLAAGRAWPAPRAGEGAGLTAALRWLGGPGRALLGLFVVGAGCVMLVQAVGAWMPTILHRGFDIPVARAAVIIGAVVLVAAPAGHLSAGWLLGRSRTRPVALITGALMLAAASATAVLFAQSPVQVIAALVALVAAGGAAAAASLITVQPMMPGHLRGGVNALYLSLTSLVGVGGGPWITGLLSDHLSDHPQGLSLALAILVVGLAAILIPVSVWLGRRWNNGARQDNCKAGPGLFRR